MHTNEQEQVSSAPSCGGCFAERLLTARMDGEMAVLERLSESDLDSFRALINVGSTVDLMVKLVRLAVAAVCPGPELGRLFAGEPAKFVAFCLDLASYRQFMDALMAGEQDVRVLVDRIAGRQRAWVAELGERFAGADEEDA